MKKLLCVITLLLLLFATAFSAVACSEKQEAEPTPSEIITRWQRTYTAGDFGIHNKKNPFVEFTLDTDETIRLELYPSVAPITVENFITYVNEGFYSGCAFHRIIKGQMIQCGGFEIKDGLYVKKPPTHDPIKGEFKKNGVNNTLSHTPGVISMANTGEPDYSASSEFFICSDLSEAVTESYDGKYAAFGRVIDEESMAVVSRLEKVETHSEPLYQGETGYTREDVPVTRVTVKSVVLVWNK